MFNRNWQLEEGKQGTIISIGCYSECLDKCNKKQTIGLLKYFLKYSNYMQLATKQEFSYEDFKEIDEHLKHKGQLHIYISLPTYTLAKEIEPNCARPEKRISVLKETAKFKNIKIYLYIKPVLNNVTNYDVGKYKELMKEYNVGCVVGDMLYQDIPKGRKIRVGEEFFYEQHTSEGQKIREDLATVGKVYKNSTDTIKDLRNS